MKQPDFCVSSLPALRVDPLVLGDTRAGVEALPESALHPGIVLAIPWLVGLVDGQEKEGLKVDYEGIQVDEEPVGSWRIHVVTSATKANPDPMQQKQLVKDGNALLDLLDAMDCTYGAHREEKIRRLCFLLLLKATCPAVEKTWHLVTPLGRGVHVNLEKTSPL